MPQQFYPRLTLALRTLLLICLLLGGGWAGPLSAQVGVGTDTPSQLLHVKGSTPTDAVLLLEPSEFNSTGDYGELRIGNTNHYIRGEFGNGMQFFDADQFSFSGGPVGIGVSAPSYKVDIAGHVALNDSTLYLRDNTASGLRYAGSSASFAGLSPGGPALYGSTGGLLGTVDGSPKAALRWNNSQEVTIAEAFTLPNTDGSGGQVLRTDGAGTLGWADQNDGDWTEASGNVYRSSGNVGLGHDTPAARLEVRPQSSLGIKIANTNDDAQSWLPNSDGSIYLTGDETAGDGDIILRSWDASNSYTEHMRIDSSGKVGIGTASPSHRLHVQDTGSSAITLLTPQDWNSTGDNAELRFGDGSHVIRGVYGEGIQFYDVNAFSFQGSNVGIGTSSPQRILDIKTGQDGNAVSLINDALGTGRPLGFQFGRAANTNNVAEVRFNYEGDGSPDNHLNLGLYGNANTMTVHGSGNVGIGLGGSQPQDELQVAGAIEADSLGLGTLAADSVRLAAATPDPYDGVVYRAEADDNPGFNLELHANSESGNVRWAFDQDNNGPTYENVWAINEGKVGIGTLTPSQQLEVQGGMRVSALAATNGDSVVTTNSNGDLQLSNMENLSLWQTDGSSVWRTGQVGVGGKPGAAFDVFGKGNVDQSQTSSGASYSGNVAQGFTAGVTGTLSGIGITFNTIDPGDKIKVEVYTGGDPNNGSATLLATATKSYSSTVPNGSEQFFPLSASLTSGNPYHFRVIKLNGGANVKGTGGNPYSGGEKYRFFSSPPPGFWNSFSGDDDLAFKTYMQAGPVARITQSGNLGIGNSSPAQKLDVAGTARISNLSGSGTRMVVADADGDLSAQSIDDNDWTEASGNVYRNTGNVGIGNSSPAQKLDVAGTARISNLSGSGTRMVVADADGDLNTQSIDDGDWVSSGSDLYYNSGNVGIGNSSPGAQLTVGGNLLMDIGNIQSVGTLRFQPDTDDSGDDNIVFEDNNGNTTMTVATDGNVGIGVGGPAGRLAVNYDNEGIQVRNSSDGAHTWIPDADGNIYLTGDEDQSGGDGDIILRSWSSGSYVEHMRVNSNGNVGIGTTSGSYPLYVQGSGARIRVEEDAGRFIELDPESRKLNFGGGLDTLEYAGGDHHFSGNVGIGVSSPQVQLDIGGTTELNDNTLRLRGDANHALRYAGPSSQFDAASVNGPALYGYDGGLLGTNQGGTENSALAWDDAGRVAVNQNSTNTGATFYVNGTAGGASGWLTFSDSSFKRDIQPLAGSLQKVAQLGGYTYHMKIGPDRGERIGVVAQEVQEVFPQAVSEMDEQGHLGVKYGTLVAPLIESVKTLKQRNEELQSTVRQQNQRIDKLEQRLQRVEELTGAKARQ